MKFDGTERRRLRSVREGKIDSLITKLSVDTSQILGSGQFGPNDVELTLDVVVRPRYPMNANIEMLFP